ncbi:hypothetical protein ACLQ9R_01315 [Bordetella hinzii]|uniref:hypothetical protein n=1 Tax=Bordetella hinzii TaxID=103855 RepID=UPI0039FD1411
MTEEEVAELLARTDKTVVREFRWIPDAGAKGGERFSFDSAVQVGSVFPYAVRFIAKYRAKRTISIGQSCVVKPAKFDAALLCTPHRVAALDTAPGTIHSNNVGVGRPYFGQRLTCATHRHIWVGSYGYAEPVEPPIMEVVDLVLAFAKECNVILNGEVTHPLLNTTGDLFQ